MKLNKFTAMGLLVLALGSTGAAQASVSVKQVTPVAPAAAVTTTTPAATDAVQSTDDLGRGRLPTWLKVVIIKIIINHGPSLS